MRWSAAAGVSRVEVAYLHKNVAPVVKMVAATPANYRFPIQVRTVSPSRNLTLPSLNGPKRSSPAKPATAMTSQSMQSSKGFAGVRWLSEDDNGDKLVYKVEIRGEAETEWKLLEEELSKAYFSWDSTAFSDGEYRVRVTASDAPSNPPSQALTAQLVGEPFLIDNSPPEISGLTVARQGGAATASWKAEDALNVIGKAEYSLDGGEWTVVQPTTRLSDARMLEYELKLESVAAGERTIAVRVSDKFDNQAVAKVVVR
ncbi:MAG: hypothetical protein GY953_00105 [bacterium]|nr:hypothetical protein [bacterium]